MDGEAHLPADLLAACKVLEDDCKDCMQQEPDAASDKSPIPGSGSQAAAHHANSSSSTQLPSNMNKPSMQSTCDGPMLLDTPAAQSAPSAAAHPTSSHRMQSETSTDSDNDGQYDARAIVFCRKRHCTNKRHIHHDHEDGSSTAATAVAAP